MSVCCCVPYAWPHFSADLDETWHVATLHPKDDGGYSIWSEDGSASGVQGLLPWPGSQEAKPPP